ncbi:unnamed protein product [Owenia fusiformis]|uniref:Chorein N-terminal domain-containing protein n=1 Tax=Owenia fusiformis TaxID=6347 RepID=A0A8S4Q3T2_OWEFU|nr:unnamed protein product [Owenia fusiformis]
MLDGLVAGLINKYLGKYIQNLDSDNLNISILSGNVELTDLQLRPEALFELDLPIEVKAGYVGKIYLSIPWTSLYSLPVIASVEDVYVIAGPLSDRKYDAEKEKNLANAIKRQKLEDLEMSKTEKGEETESNDQGFFDSLAATIVNNIQVFVKNIHIRYEDNVTIPNQPFAFGVTLKNFSAETTNSQWQVTQIDSNAQVIHKQVKLDSLSAYWNAYCPEQSLVRGKLFTTAWRNLLKNSLETKKIMNEDFDYVIRPISGETKVILNKDGKLNIPMLIADLVIEDIDIIFSRQQYLNLMALLDSFKLMALNQRYRKYAPDMPVKGNAHLWWKYAYNAIVEEKIRPYSWSRIKEHRNKYRQYKNLYKRKLENPSDNEVKNRLKQLEDNLDIANILMAREHAKLEFTKEAPERADKKEKEQSWWNWAFGSDDSDDEEKVVIDKSRTDWLSKLTPEEKEKLYKGIGYDVNASAHSEHPPEYVAHKINIHLTACTISLVNYSREVLKVSVANFSTAIQNRPQSNGFRIGGRTESFIVEGASVENDLVAIITSDIGVYAPVQDQQVFNFDFDMNPVYIAADFAVRLNVQPVEIVYDKHSLSEVLSFFQAASVSASDIAAAATSSLNQMVEISRAGLYYAINQHKTIHLSVNMHSPYVVIPEYGTLHRRGNVLVLDFGKLKVESELQTKDINLEDATFSEIETRLYDKFNITVTDVKALLADSGDDWHTAQTQADSKYHIIPTVEMQLSFFNTVKPDYKALPQQKIVANLPTLKLNVSDEKIVMLSDFLQNIPLPSHSESIPMMMSDSVDGGLNVDTVHPVFSMEEVVLEPSLNDLKALRRSVWNNSVIRRPRFKRDQVDRTAKRLSHLVIPEDEEYYSASDHSDEEVEEWARL